jgi:hypothetical protein
MPFEPINIQRAHGSGTSTEAQHYLGRASLRPLFPRLSSAGFKSLKHLINAICISDNLAPHSRLVSGTRPFELLDRHIAALHFSKSAPFDVGFSQVLFESLHRDHVDALFAPDGGEYLLLGLPDNRIGQICR